MRLRASVVSSIHNGRRKTMPTPSMVLFEIKKSYRHHSDSALIFNDLECAFRLGHEFGIERSAQLVDQCNQEGPYNAIGAASRIRALVVAEVKPVATIDKDFL
jgi:hypothetical protein